MSKEFKILYHSLLKIIALVMLGIVFISFFSMLISFILIDQLKIDYAQTPSLTPIVLEQIQQSRGDIANMTTGENTALENWLSNFSEFENDQLEFYQRNRVRLNTTIENFAILIVALPLYLYNRRKIKALQGDTLSDILNAHEKEIEELKKNLQQSTKKRKIRTKVISQK